MVTFFHLHYHRSCFRSSPFLSILLFSPLSTRLFPCKCTWHTPGSSHNSFTAYDYLLYFYVLPSLYYFSFPSDLFLCTCFSPHAQLISNLQVSKLTTSLHLFFSRLFVYFIFSRFHFYTQLCSFLLLSYYIHSLTFPLSPLFIHYIFPLCFLPGQP